jgi:hypothetical protein
MKTSIELFDETLPKILTEKEFIEFVEIIVEKDRYKNHSLIALSSHYVFNFSDYPKEIRKIENRIALARQTRSIYIQKQIESKRWEP